MITITSPSILQRSKQRPQQVECAGGLSPPVQPRSRGFPNITQAPTQRRSHRGTYQPHQQKMEPCQGQAQGRSTRFGWRTDQKLLTEYLLGARDDFTISSLFSPTLGTDPHFPELAQETEVIPSATCLGPEAKGGGAVTHGHLTETAPRAVGKVAWPFTLPSSIFKRAAPTTASQKTLG